MVTVTSFERLSNDSNEIVEKKNLEIRCKIWSMYSSSE